MGASGMISDNLCDERCKYSDESANRFADSDDEDRLAGSRCQRGLSGFLRQQFPDFTYEAAGPVWFLNKLYRTIINELVDDIQFIIAA